MGLYRSYWKNSIFYQGYKNEGKIAREQSSCKYAVLGPATRHTKLSPIPVAPAFHVSAVLFMCSMSDPAPCKCTREDVEAGLSVLLHLGNIWFWPLAWPSPRHSAFRGVSSKQKMLIPSSVSIK